MIYIHNAYNKSEVAKLYYHKLSGEALTNREAANRWRKLKNPRIDILLEVFEEIFYQQQKNLLK